MSVLYITSAAIIIVFLRQIVSNKNIINNKVQKSLIISSIIQITLTCVFLVTPLYCYFIFVKFDVPNTAQVMTALLCIYSSHCLLDFCATIYFVKPYKIFVLKMIGIKQIETSKVVTTGISSDVRMKPRIIYHGIR